MSEYPPLHVSESPFLMDAIDEPSVLNISGAAYADLIKVESIVRSRPLFENINVIRDSSYLDLIRKSLNRPEIGVLRLELYEGKVKIIIVDTNREVIKKS